MAKKKRSVVVEDDPVEVEVAVPEPAVEAVVEPVKGAPLRIRTPLSPVLRNGVLVCYVEPGANLGFLR